jgi:formylglycine-generating enzyme required for sulfatase activity
LVVIPGWTGEDATLDGGSPPSSDDGDPHLAPGWTGEDATMGGGSSAITPRPPTARTVSSREPREESSATLLGWTGEDATMGGGSSAVTPRPNGQWQGDGATPPAGTPAGTPQALDPLSPETAERLGTFGVFTPIHTGTTNHEGAVGTTDTGRTKGSDRLRTVSASLRSTVVDEMRRKDAAWLKTGRSADLSGTTLGDFLVGTVIGEGGMGVVYRARQISLDRRVALKVLPPALAADPMLMERFAAEAHTAGLIVSPHVVQVYFAGHVDEQVFFAMEFVSGTDLARPLAQHRSDGTHMPVDLAARLLAQAARGLAEAEAHQVVHRDIKPQNLLVTDDGVLKIADFGIAKVAGEHHLTLTGSAVGTPAYCSPEQGRGDTVDHRSDLYALGVVFYEMLTGQKPFSGTQADQLIYQHNYAEPKPPRSLRPDLDALSEAVCMRLLMKEPDQRYQHAADLAVDLEALIRGGQVQAPPFQIRFGTGAKLAMRRHLGLRRWIPYTVATVAAAVVVVVVAVTLWLGSQSLEADEVARRRAELAGLDRVASIPRSAPADLDWLAARLGAANPDVARWRAKLDQVEALRVRLARLDAADRLPDAALRMACAADLAAWEAAVGGADPDRQRWQARLQAAQEEMARLRGVLEELDRTDLVTAALADRLRPVLARMILLAGANDAEVQRWQGLIVGQARRLADARTALTELAVEKPIREPRLKALRDEWRAYRALAGDDADAVAWGRELERRENELAELRRSGARLDSVDVATTTLQAAIAGDLARMADLAAPDDVQLAAWNTKIATSNRRIDTLRQALGAVLDRHGDVDVNTLNTCELQIGEYRSLVSADDGRLAAWDRALKARFTTIQDQRATLAILKKEEHPTLAELDACQKALERLVAFQAVNEADRTAAVSRLATEREYIAALRSALDRANTPGGGITATVVQQAEALATLAGAEDPQVRVWQDRLITWRQTREALIGFERLGPPPSDAETLLAAYAAIVPAQDADLARWRGKLSRIAVLYQRLAPLDRAENPPADSAALLDELARDLTGEADAVVQRGRAKLARFAELDTQLMVLDQVLVLPMDRDLGPLLAERRRLAKDGTPRSLGREQRHRQLAGPGRPAWCKQYGRDRHGPWAELSTGGSSQRLRFIPGGVMRLGSPVDETDREADESPAQDVPMDGFWIADTECTQALYASVMMVWPAQYRALDRPVENVTRSDTLGFCAQLAQRLGGAVDVRLPTEREWEYACRAGVAGPYIGAEGPLDAARLSAVAWLGRNDGSQPVALLQPNRFGLYDMQGNVWEWVADRYLADGAGGGNGVVRGGSWTDRPALLRAANRLALGTERSTALVGFRFAISAVWPEVTTGDGAAPAASDRRQDAPR